MDKLQTVRDTLKDANEINEYKEKELNEKVKLLYGHKFPLKFASYGYSAKLWVRRFALQG